MSDLFALHWLTPQAFWLVLLVPVALWLGQARGGIVTFAPSASSSPWPDAPRTWRDRTAWMPAVVTGLGLCAVVTALARPAERHSLPVEPRGSDIVLCLDTSSSMAATDLDGERRRLDVARTAAARFVGARPDDRIGLVTFARYPDLRCPPTRDHRALLRALGEVELVAEESTEDLTGIGTALAEAAQAMETGGENAAGRVAILLTDGEETVAHAAAEAGGDAPTEIGPRAAARVCDALGVRVHAIAIGARDRVTGQQLDTQELADVADIAGGAFFAAADAQALGRIYARIDQLEANAPAAPEYELRDRFAPFLLLGLALLALGWCLRHTAWRLET